MPLYTNQIRHADNRVTVISGSFAPAATGAVTAVRGKGFTVARTDVGTFTITLDRKYLELLSATAAVQLASAADMAPQFGAVDLSARTVVLRTQAGATATDIAADANNRVHFVLEVRDSAL